jgi:hypothetical protein
MTARTALTPTALVQDGSVAEGAGTAIAGLVAAGATVASPPGPNKVILLVNNTATASKNVTVRAGGSGNTAAGGTNPGVPFEAATVGDLVTAVSASGTLFIGPLSSARFTQADGSMSIDFDSGTTGTIWVFQLPNQHIVEGF